MKSLRFEKKGLLKEMQDCRSDTLCVRGGYMRIFILSPTYPDEFAPVANIFVYEQAKELANLGHELIILHVKRLPTSKIFSHPGKEIEIFDDEFAIRYCILQKTFAETRYPALNKIAFLKSSERLYQYATTYSGKPDVIYAHFSCWAGYAANMLSEKYNVPVVTIEHFSGFIEKETISKTLKKCTEYTIKHSRYFLCVSEGLRRAISKNVTTKKDLYVVPNMISREFQYVEPILHKGFVFLAVGRLTAPKDYKTLLDAFAVAFKPNQEVFLRIGGDGPERKKLERYVKKIGRTGQIKFLGQLDRKDTIIEYIHCDCFALSSAWETYGMVYREALVTGRPIITTDHGGFSGKDWKDEYGYKVPVHDVHSFANAMKMMVDNYRNFDGHKISKMCLCDCSPDIIVRRVEHFLRKAIEK